jgi:ribosomal protein S12
MFLGQLLDEWRRLEFEGFKKIRNLGTKSVRQIELLVHALKNRDPVAASLFLPLCPSGRGLSLSAALALLARLPNSAERAMLHRRLINRMTLAESAEEAGVTRERVRQIEEGFLEEMQARWIISQRRGTICFTHGSMDRIGSSF